MSNIVFTSRQAYAATLAMRLGKPLPASVIAGWSPQQLNAAISSANTRLSQAHAASKAPGYQHRQVSAAQRHALTCWAVGFGSPLSIVNHSTVPNATVANATFIGFGRASQGQPKLVSNVYAAWLAQIAMRNRIASAPVSAQSQLALF